MNYQEIESLCGNFRIDYSMSEEYNSIIFNHFKMKDVLDSVRSHSSNIEIDNHFLFNVFEGMVYELATKRQKIAALIAASFLIIHRVNNYIYIQKTDIESIKNNVSGCLKDMEPLIKEGNSKIEKDVMYIIKNIQHSSKTGRRVNSYTDDEVGLRVIRDSLKLFVLCDKPVVNKKIEQIIEINQYRNIPNSFNNVVEDVDIFIEKLQKDLIVNQWSTQWSKRKVFFTNFIQHCKDKITTVSVFA